jgi:rhamnosyltransferase subunit B
LRYVASAFGSAGDFLPTLAVARALAGRGHEITFVTNPFHEHTVRAAGLDYRAAGEHVDLYRLILDDPGLLTSPRALRFMAEDLAPPHFAATYHRIGAMLRAERVDAVIGSNLEFGAHWAAIERGVPAVMVAATPLMWLSPHSPTQFLDLEIPASMLPWAIRAVRAVAVALIDHALRSIARSCGATSFDASYSGVARAVALHVGTWPTLMRAPAVDDLPNMRASGYVRAGHLGTSAPALSAELERFLATGDPPVVIALGSIFSLDSDDLVADAAEACVDVGRRCVVVGRAPRGRELPEGTLVVPYATYHLLFPRASAIVGHGGAGTTGETLRSGRPTVVVPLAFDQFGLAWEVERLGAGVRVPRRGRSRATIARALRRACEDATVAERAAQVAAELRDQPDGAERTADLITSETSRAGWPEACFRAPR